MVQRLGKANRDLRTQKTRVIRSSSGEIPLLQLCLKYSIGINK